MNARAPLFLAAALAALLSGCNRESVGPTEPASTSAAKAASAPASAASTAAAGPLVPASSPSLIVPVNVDTNAGRQIASQGAPGAAACATCHGANGEGNGASGFPRLAAMGSVYLLHQLNSYADGTRANPVMTPIASALNPQQRAEVSAYFSTLGGATNATAASPAASGASAAAATGGAAAGTADASAMGAARATPPAPALAVRGDESKGIQACVNCHGPQGIGDAGPNPYLAGQHAQYLANAMAAWKSGERHNDPSGQMPAIAKALDDAQVQSLVAYFSALPPPQPRNAQAAMPSPVAAQRAAVKSGPVSATAPTQGVGTDQGASTTGGSQSQGVGGAAQNPGQGPNR